MHTDAQLRRHELRRQARAARRDLSEAERSAATQAFHTRLESLPAFSQAHRVGCYVAVASELSLETVIEQALARGQQIYLPHVEHTAPVMQFALWSGLQKRLLTNRFGIPEPLVDVAELVPADSMDVILLPLLAFDRSGGRLGSGAGYYDRALAFRLARPAPPLLIGIGFACQEVSGIPMADWDVPLDLVVTERELIVIGVEQSPLAANDP